MKKDVIRNNEELGYYGEPLDGFTTEELTDLVHEFGRGQRAARAGTIFVIVSLFAASFVGSLVGGLISSLEIWHP